MLNKKSQDSGKSKYTYYKYLNITIHVYIYNSYRQVSGNEATILHILEIRKAHLKK